MYIRSARAEDQQRIKIIVRRAHITPYGLHWQRFVVVEEQGIRGRAAPTRSPTTGKACVTRTTVADGVVAPRTTVIE